MRDARHHRGDALHIAETQARADGAARQSAVNRVDQPACIRALALNPQLESADAADAQPPLQATHHAAEELAIGQQFREPGGIPHGEDPAEKIAVPADVFCAGVHYDVRAVEEGVLQGRGREGRVDEEEGPGGVGDLGVVGNVEGEAGGVDRGFEDKEIALGEGGGGAVEGEFGAGGEALVEGDDAVGAVVARADGDGAGVEEGEERVEGREPRGVR